MRSNTANPLFDLYLLGPPGFLLLFHSQRPMHAQIFRETISTNR
jgi:hypothetical protein